MAAVSRYQRPALQALAQELEEEAGLKLDDNEWFPLVMVPAFLCRKYERDGNPRTTIDLAFSTPVQFSAFEPTAKFFELMERGGLMFVPRAKLPEIEIVSPRTRFLIEQALEINDLIARR